MFDEEWKVVAWIVVIILLIGFVVGLRGVFVSTDKAMQAAEVQLATDNLELSRKHIMFVHWRGCDKNDVAMFRVLPYTNAQGKTVDNAIVCAGWPFKGITVRFK